MVKFFVSDATGELHQIEAFSNDTLLDIKHKLCKQIDLQVTKEQLDNFAKSIRFELGGKSLNDKSSVSDSHIKNFDTLYMKGNLLAGADIITITVTDLEGNDFRIPIEVSAKIEVLKNKLYALNHIETHTYNLTFNGKTLLASKTFQHYNIITENTLQYIPAWDELILHVLDFKGHKSTIELTKQSTVKQLKEAIYDKHSIEPDHQAVNALGRVIGANSKDGSDNDRDKNTLDYYELDGIVAVVVTRRFHGG